MAIGPEIVWAWSTEISSQMTGKRCTGILTGPSWAVLSFSPDFGILCSLHHGHYGCCRTGKDDISTLRATAGKMPRFDEILRKHVTGAKLAAAEQVCFDRILKLSFDKEIGAGFIQRANLVFEFMSHRSNLFITDGEGRIIEALHPVHPEDQRSRTAFPGTEYTPPPPVSGRILPELLEDPAFDRPVAGLGKELSSALEKASHEWPRDSMARDISSFLGDSADGMIFQRRGKTLTLFPALLPDAVPVKAENALDAARDTVLSPLIIEETERLKRQVLRFLQKDLKDTRARLQGLETRKRQAAEAWKWKRAGELLLAWQHNVPRRACEAELTDWEKDPPESVKIALDPALSPVENARSYFRLFKKKKIPVAALEKEITNLGKRERSLRNMIAEAVRIDDLSAMRRFGEDLDLLRRPGRKQRRKNPPYRRFDLDGALVLVGKNERGNRNVAFDLSRGDDLWLHARDVPGSHVILRRLDGKEKSFSPDDRRLLFAASLAAYYSKNRAAGRVAIDYTERRHVTAQKGAVAGVTYRQGRSVVISPLYWKEHFEGTP